MKLFSLAFCACFIAAACATTDDEVGGSPGPRAGGKDSGYEEFGSGDSSVEDSKSDDSASDAVSSDAGDAGDAEIPSDASDASSDAPVDSGPDAPVDSGPDAPIDAGSDAAPGCQWVEVNACDTGGTIAQFCSGTVKTLRRCDQTLYIPDAVYLQFHLCSCTFQACGCNGVAWDAVECCN